MMVKKKYNGQKKNRVPMRKKKNYTINKNTLWQKKKMLFLGKSNLHIAYITI